MYYDVVLKEMGILGSVLSKVTVKADTKEEASTTALKSNEDATVVYVTPTR